jgi:hypothetical protein
LVVKLIDKNKWRNGQDLGQGGHCLAKQPNNQLIGIGMDARPVESAGGRDKIDFVAIEFGAGHKIK